MYYSFASSEIPWIFSMDFYFILYKVAPICLVEEFYIFRAALQNDWMIRNYDDWFCFFFTRRGALPLFRVPPHCSLNVFVRMALPTINTPPSPIILKFWNTQYSAKGRQSIFIHRRKKTCGRCPCIFQGGSAHLPVWAQTLLLAQWKSCVNTTLLTALLQHCSNTAMTMHLFTQSQIVLQPMIFVFKSSIFFIWPKY